MFQLIGGKFDAILDTFINTAASDVVSTITMLGIGGASIYFCVIGYLMMAGRIDKPFEKFMIDCAKFLFISAFALNISNYLEWVVGSVRSLETGLTAAFTGTLEKAPDNVYVTIDQNIKKGADLANSIFINAAERDKWDIGGKISDYLNAWIIIAATEAICLTCGTIIIIMKFGLTICLGIGPLFVMMLMFKPTARFFDSWVAQILTYVIGISLVLAVFMFGMNIFTEIIGPLNPNTTNAVGASVALVTIAFVILFLIREVVQISGRLAGGFSSTGFSAGQAVRGVMGFSESVTPRRNPKQPKNDDKDDNKGGGKVTNDSSNRPPWHDAMMKNRNKDRG